MRPITRGGPGRYSVPATIQFSAKRAAAVKKIIKTVPPTVQECLDLWLELAAKGTSAIDYKKKKAALDAIVPRIQAIYKKAAMPLIQSFGDFCSYCETRIPGNLDVEHAMGKAEFPTFAVEWDNFLLACGPCNTQKLDSPDRSDVRGWLPHDIKNEAECETQVRSKHYVWPDLDAGSYQVLPIELHFDDQGTWKRVPTPHDVDPENTCSVDLPNEKVYADFPNWGTSGKFNVSVQARVIAGGTISRPQEMIDLCDLNRIGGAPYDGGVVNRTRAWFETLAALKALDGLSKSKFEAVWRTVGGTARYLGFFSVWLRGFDNPNTIRDPSGAKLSTRFRNDFSGDFPGTNTVRLP